MGLSCLNLSIYKHFIFQAQDQQRLTPLHLSCTYGQTAVAKILLEHGANIHCFGEQHQVRTNLRTQTSNDREWIARKFKNISIFSQIYNKLFQINSNFNQTFKKFVSYSQKFPSNLKFWFNFHQNFTMQLKLQNNSINAWNNF